jgi:hypothetical protein
MFACIGVLVHSSLFPWGCRAIGRATTLDGLGGPQFTFAPSWIHNNVNFGPL